MVYNFVLVKPNHTQNCNTYCNYIYVKDSLPHGTLKLIWPYLRCLWIDLTIFYNCTVYNFMAHTRISRGWRGLILSNFRKLIFLVYLVGFLIQQKKRFRYLRWILKNFFASLHCQYRLWSPNFDMECFFYFVRPRIYIKCQLVPKNRGFL